MGWHGIQKKFLSVMGWDGIQRNSRKTALSHGNGMGWDGTGIPVPCPTLQEGILQVLLKNILKRKSVQSKISNSTRLNLLEQEVLAMLLSEFSSADDIQLGI